MIKCISASIVLYNSSYSNILILVNKLKSSEYINKIYLIDNSERANNDYADLEVEYIFNGENIGFGKGHNIAIQQSIIENYLFHLVLNSDLDFEISVIEALYFRITDEDKIGMIMPKVLNYDNSIQLLPKLLPTPFNLLIRVLKPLGLIFKKTNELYVLKDHLDIELNTPIISGCFSLFRIDALKEVGLYDEAYFMYFEDFDISRRIHEKFKTLYYPEVCIIHKHERGAVKSFKLFFIFICSAIKYFNKYGWFVDVDRKVINRKLLKSL